MPHTLLILLPWWAALGRRLPLQPLQLIQQVRVLCVAQVVT